jgi:hypothetical protein
MSKLRDARAAADGSNWSDLDLESLSLIVAWWSGALLKSSRVPLTVGVAEELRDICRGVLTDLDEREERPWHPDALNESDEYLLATLEQLGNESEVLRVVQSAEFDVLSAAELPNRDFFFYALIGGPANRRVAFIRKYNIRRGLRRRLVTIFGETLSKVDGQIFTFDDKADVVIDPQYGVAILATNPFQYLFRASPEMIARMPQYVSEISQSLPIGDDAKSMLIELAQGNMSVLRRLQNIATRGHLPSVSMGTIKDEMRNHGLDPTEFIVDGCLVFDRASVKDILKLLNEDLFRGGLTGQDFQVDRKSAR